MDWERHVWGGMSHEGCDCVQEVCKCMAMCKRVSYGDLRRSKKVTCTA